jgi:anti-anti-sigma regulatory factor
MALIKCQPDLDIATAATLRQQLLDALQMQQPLEIDGQAVRKIHTAVLQLFLSLIIEAQARAVPVHWRNPSPALLEGARLLGLADRLGLEPGAESG